MPIYVKMVPTGDIINGCAAFGTPVRTHVPDVIEPLGTVHYASGDALPTFRYIESKWTVRPSGWSH